MSKNKLVPVSRVFPKKNDLADFSAVSVVVDEHDVPHGFVFGRESFISFLQALDDEFETQSSSEEAAHNNMAGRLIDMIEERLPMKKSFVQDLKRSVKATKNTDWIPFDDVIQSVHG